MMPAYAFDLPAARSLTAATALSLVLACAFGASVATATASGVPARTADAALAAEVDRLMLPLVEGDLVSGAVAISGPDGTLFAKGYGLADREHGVPNTPQTPFRIASLSKAVTATAVLHLVDEGRVALAAPLETYVPGFPNGDRITVEQLLGHRSGIPSDVYLEGFREMSARSTTLAEAIGWTRERAEPRFEPGARFDYSNSNYLLLTAIVEAAGGLPFARSLQERVFAPAGMSASGLDSRELVLPGRARGYSRDESGRVVDAAYRDPTFGWGCGALYSTALDLLSFERALREGRLLTPASLDLMWAGRSETPWGDRYGMGWFVGGSDEEPTLTALGATGGFTAALRRHPAAGVVVVVLLNRDFALFRELCDRLSSIALGEPWRPLFASGDGLHDARLESFVGTYEMEGGELCELRIRDGGLEFCEPGAGTCFRVFVLSDTEGYVAEQNARLRFSPLDDGGSELRALYGNLAWNGRRRLE